MLRTAVRSVSQRPSKRLFTVLALESSADDSCAAVVTSSGRILSNIVVKQNDLHEQTGGIHTIVALHAHQRNMPRVVQRALREADVDIIHDVDGIAVTRGPGMAGCLNVAFNAAKTLSAALNKPLIGVHHMQAHALVSSLSFNDTRVPAFPFLSLLISGGHTMLVLAHSTDSFKILATTTDMSIGRAFDKTSRILNLQWTSLGPGDALEKFCAEDPDSTPTMDIPSFPKVQRGVLGFSYSGLYSIVERFVDRCRDIENIDLPTRRSLARAFQTSAVDHLVEKLQLGLFWCRQRDILIKDVVVGGGVASNLYLRKRLDQFLSSYDSPQPIALSYPPGYLCTDNAVMIGWASMHRFKAQDYDDYDIEILPTWSLEDLTTLRNLPSLP